MARSATAAVLLLALKGLTDDCRFVPLIEKFGLLEHLHRRYRDAFEAALKISYRPRAFMGSGERAKSGNEWIDTPMLSPTCFRLLDEVRRGADGDDDFAGGFDPASGRGD